MAEEDLINHPKHYNSLGAKCECGRPIECIDVTRNMGFNLGNVTKYIWRAIHKNGLEDLKKARWYLNDLIKQEEAAQAIKNYNVNKEGFHAKERA